MNLSSSRFTELFWRPATTFRLRMGAAFVILVCVLAPGLSTRTFAEIPLALPPGQLPKDHRLDPLKDLDGYFPFQPAATTAVWEKRAERVRRQIQVTLGLWPMPSRTPLNAVIHGKVERDDYTVERVYFESYPGFFVTGSLYRPKGKTGKLPGVLAPHGHWNNGRFYDNSKVLEEIAEGAERFEDGGRSPLQSRCVHLARMGCVTFHYDMIGYADSQQLSLDLAHNFREQRPDMISESAPGLFSPQAEAHLQSVMGLQTYNSIRALDFLLELPDVDPKRVAVSGASGGGTQTFILCALDPRPAVAFPAVMVSTAMQGGCTCENACGLRIDTGNVEFAALFAPKPLGMTAANDWTKDMPTKGFPQLKEHYKLLGAPDNVFLKAAVHFDHNYNAVSRSAFYHWCNLHFGLGLPEPIIERPYQRLSIPEMSVWNAQHPKPPGGPEFERKLLRWIRDDATRQLAEAERSPGGFRKIAAPALDVLVGRSLEDVGPVTWKLAAKNGRGAYLEMAGLLENTRHGEQLPAIFLHPVEWNSQTVLWIDQQGKAGLYRDDGSLKPEIQQLIAAGYSVAGLDLMSQGEFLRDKKAPSETRTVKNSREFAGYTFGYNHTLFAQRVHDILTAISFIQHDEHKSKRIHLVGVNGAGHWAAVACAQAGNAIDRAAIDTAGFRFNAIKSIRSPDFFPGGAKYQDLPGILALGAPRSLWLAGEPEPARAQIAASRPQQKGNLHFDEATPDRAPGAAAQWLASNAK